MKRGRESLKRSLTRQYVLLACAPLLMVVVLWSAVAIPQTMREIEDENQRTALLVRAQVELLLAAPREAVARAATRVTPGTPSIAIRAALSAALDEAPPLESVTLLDGHGVVELAEVRPGTGARARDWEGLDLSHRPFYARAHAATAPSWSDTFQSPLTGNVTAVVAAPAGDRLVVANLSLDDLAQQIHVPLGAGDIAVIVFDGMGRVIVHPQQQQLANWQENLGEMRMVQEALAGRSGPGQITLGGRRWLATVAPAATTGWYVLVAQPRNALFQPVERLAGVVGVAVLVVLICVVLIALRLAQRQALRYRQLVGAASDLVDDRPGERDMDADLGSEEVNALWTQLRRLLDRSKEQERAARHAQAELQAVLDAATEVAIIAVDARHVIRLFNRGAEKMLGYRAHELVGVALQERLHEPGEILRRAAELTQQLEHPVAGTDAVTAIAARFGHEVRDWTYLRKDGSHVSVSLAVTAVNGQSRTSGVQALLTRGERGIARALDAASSAPDALGFLYVATDQSERIRTAELELARRRAEAASQAKSEFLSRVSHELRTPMNAMLGYAQLLQLEEVHRLDDYQRERVARIEAAGWHLVTLINDVLDLSTIESGNARIQMPDVDVGHVINESARLVSPLADAAQVAPHVALPVPAGSDAWLVQADATRLRQVLVNVLGNAVKYNRAHGRVDVSVRLGSGVGARSANGMLEIDVSDTGRGMTAAQLARLFSAFDRLGLESSAIEGTGIGLVISRRLIERMGGDIVIESQPDVGTRVVLTLQRTPAAARAAGAQLEGLPPAAVSSGASGHIVYVEDNPINALLMQEVVAQRPDCTLHLAVSVADGIAMVERLLPALVLVDLHLPDGSGLDVARAMRGVEALAQVPVVVVSADSTQPQRDAALAAGARAYLAKPVNLAQALKLIDELLGPGR